MADRINRDHHRHYSDKRIYKIMRTLGIQSIIRPKRRSCTVRKNNSTAKNNLNRDFNASRPNEKWVTDISYIHTEEGILYLSMIRDLYDNSIVGYKYATQMPASLVIETVRAAVKNAKPSGGLILHSDNGFQYTSQAYYNVAIANGIKPSMSSVGCPYDNACAENFFGHWNDPYRCLCDPGRNHLRRACGDSLSCRKEKISDRTLSFSAL